MCKISFHWLGSPEIELDGYPVRLEMRKTLAVLAYISISPQGIGRETLADLFWPEFDQQHALSNLRRSLSSLTKSLPVEIFQIDRDRVGLRKEMVAQVDVDMFRGLVARANGHDHPLEQVCLECRSVLEKAIGCYRGDFFAGFNLKDCPTFDEWQFFQRESLRADYAQALEQLAVSYQATCEWEKAIPLARSWLALDRLNEPAQRLLMRLFYRSGQKSAAIRQYEECERILEEELGQPPEPETLQVYREICKEAPPTASGNDQSWEVEQDTQVANPKPLIRMKHFIPKVPRFILHRPRLVSRLNQCISFPLTIISASAGFGKTTLLAEWAEQSHTPVAWIALDPDDNDAYRLANYILQAFQTVLPAIDFGSEVRTLPHASSPVTPSDLLSSLVNELTTRKDPVVLVLDDYHVIHAPAACAVINELLDHCPPALRVIISTRTEATLSLARLRANGQMAEIRMDDLRFSVEEAQDFLHQLLGLKLPIQDLAALDEKTEGWIAGIQMAALAMQARPASLTIPAVQAFLHAFKGSHRYIMDYLLEEALNQQPEEIRDFLFRTSILEKMCWFLCDCLLEEPDRRYGIETVPAEQGGSLSSQQILEYLERNNLFLVPLDEEKLWYRYHHLFADLLQVRLRQNEPKREAVLHRKAANWHAQNGYPAEAIRHAIAAGDPVLTADFIEKFSNMFIARSETATVQGWIDSLPEEIAHQRPWILLYQTWIQAHLGQMENLEDSLVSVERLLTPCIPDAEKAEMRDFITMMRAYQANMSGDSELAIHFALGDAQDHLGRITTQHYKVHYQLGYAYYARGELCAAGKIFQEVAAAAEEAGDIYNAIISQVELGGIQLLQGRLSRAEAIYRQALDWVGRNVQKPDVLDCIIKASLAAVAYEKNDLETAAQLANESVEAAIAGNRTNTLAYGLSLQAYILLANAPKSPDYLCRARAAIEQAVRHIQTHKTYPRTVSQVNACRVAIWLAEENLDEAQHWARLELRSAPTVLGFQKELEYIAVAQVYLALHAWQEAFQLLEKLAEQALLGERYGRLVKIHLLQALACQGLGETELAISYLEKSLSIAIPEGYLRTFLDMGNRLEELLLLGKEKESWQTLGFTRYTDQIFHWLFVPTPK